MLTARLETLPPATPGVHRNRLHRGLLRLRARWLRWRGQAVLRAVAPAPAPHRPSPDADALPARPAAETSFAAQREGLLRLNLFMETARQGQSTAHQPPGLAG